MKTSEVFKIFGGVVVGLTFVGDLLGVFAKGTMFYNMDAVTGLILSLIFYAVGIYFIYSGYEMENKQVKII